MSGLRPGSPVATLDREVGYVWGVDRARPLAVVVWPDAHRVTLERWSDLLDEPEWCTVCQDPTFPGFTECARHGGPDPAPPATVVA